MFCVNKDHPEMHCDGSCMLEEMANHSHNEDSNFPPIQKVFQVDLNYYIIDLSTTIDDTTENKTTHNFHYIDNYAFLFYDYLQRPPIYS